METFETPGAITKMPTPPQTPVPLPKEGHGGLIAIIIILLIVALGGGYVWYTKSMSAKIPTQVKNTPTNRPTDDATLQRDLQAAGTVDINTDLGNLDSEFAK